MADEIVSTCDWASFHAAVQALQAAGGGNLVLNCAGTITFEETVFISEDVTISGPEVTFTGPGPLFDVGLSDSLTLVGMAVEGAEINATGGTARGAAIRSQGALTVIGVYFLFNSVTNDTGYAQGGAIYASGTTTVIGSYFIGNEVAGDVAMGGAIYSASTLSVHGSYFEANRADGDDSGSMTASSGGAIHMQGGAQRVIRHSEFVGNVVTDTHTREGGALFSFGDVPLAIEDSKFEGNSAGHGGAVYHYGTLDVERSTFFDNHATTSNGGAIAIWGFQSGTEQLQVRASTFSQNSAASSAGAIFGAQNTNTTIIGSTFYGNDAGESGDALDAANQFNVVISVGGSIIDIGPATANDLCEGDITSLGYNVISDASCGSPQATDQFGVEPLLGALQNNGGPTRTHMPTVSSPAIDAIDAVACSEFSTDLDQRGAERPVNTDCDTGAVEVNGIVPVTLDVLFNEGPTVQNVPVEIIAAAHGPEGASLQYSFDCDGNGSYGDPGDVGPQAANYADCVFDTGGNHVVNVQVSDGSTSDTDSTTVTVVAPAPTVGPVSFNPTSVNQGDTVEASATFSLPGSPTILTCSVNYGDGSGDQAGTVAGGLCTGPSHTYEDDDDYSVVVEVCADGACDSSSATLSVLNVAPTVGAVGIDPTELDEGQQAAVQVTFSDPGEADTHTCSIDWGDGSITSGTIDQSAGTCQGTHTYEDDGQPGTSADSYTISVTVSDDDDGTSSPSTGSITVNNLPPQILAFFANGTLAEDEIIELQVQATDPAGPLHDPLAYEFDCMNDGVFEIGPQDSSTAACIYAASGTYTAAVRVTDDDLGSAVETLEIEVTNVVPDITSLSVSPASIDEGGLVTLVAGFADTPSDSHTCTIDWGDGSQGSGEVDQTTRICLATHTYADDAPPGTPFDDFTVTVEISDGDDMDSASATVTVNNLPPVIESITTNAPVPQGQPVQVNVAATDPADALDPLTYEFDCANDGTFEITPQPGSSAACTLAPGAATTTIVVRVTDDDGGQASDSIVISQTVTLCVVRVSGHLYGPIAGGSCNAGQYALTLPAPAPLQLCLNRMTTELAYFGPSGCTGQWIVLTVPDAGPIAYCQNVFTNKLTYLLPTRTCGLYERQGVIPGN